MYAEQAWEMRANDIKPPTFRKWCAARERGRRMAAERKRAKEGA